MKNTNIRSSLVKRLAASGLSICLAVSALPTVVYAGSTAANSASKITAVNEISYKETLEDTHNPYRGFYQAYEISYKRDSSNCKAQASTLENIDGIASKYQLVHLLIDLSDFSAQNRKGENPVKHSDNAYIDSSKDDVEKAFGELLARLRKNNQSAVIRFAYDYKYRGKTADGVDEDGNHYYRTVWEPTDDKFIEQHQEKVGAVISRYTDVIAAVECGIIGPWGEMHTSDRTDAASEKKIIGKWLEVLPEDLTVNVRKPSDFCAWSGVKLKNIDSYVAKEGTDAYRIGLYNDGYLGSVTDLGTYKDRDKEIKWLTTQTDHTLFGGELVLWDDEEGGAPLNNIAYFEKEGFKTHTSYLNKDWHDGVMDGFRSTTYNGGDSLYKGKTSEFDYLRNRMGYRFVVRDVQMTTELSADENFALETTIENVGFGNLFKNEQTSVIIKGNGLEKEFKLWDLDSDKGEKASNYDARKWLSGTSLTDRKSNIMSAELDLPDDMPEGTYKVYFKIANRKNGEGEYPIRFSNEGSNVYDTKLKANFVGSFKINTPIKVEAPTSYPTNIKVTYSEKYHQVRFTWDKVEGADRYGIAVYLAGKWRVQTQNIIDTIYTSPKNLTPGMSYRVAIAARVNGKWDTVNAIKNAGTITIK
ncbi:DUF4832 domain-containing protein [Ruminococcus albus]|uniref:Fibronectin type III domain protein n=1 Tax=Ruminococcus albus TaxID=1264 RepID=A0A1H7J3T5_RUMAL|nr:DUF4832 domain-containing protein [Ruminococcus albus]SEK69433.1 protein of unknown function [Ruminococcus albus]